MPYKRNICDVFYFQLLVAFKKKKTERKGKDYKERERKRKEKTKEERMI